MACVVQRARGTAAKCREVQGLVGKVPELVCILLALFWVWVLPLAFGQEVFVFLHLLGHRHGRVGARLLNVGVKVLFDSIYVGGKTDDGDDNEELQMWREQAS